MTYEIGDAVALKYIISAAATVTLTVTDPDGTTSTPSPTQSGSPPEVVYTANVAATKAGTWLFRFQATGAVVDAEEGSYFVVSPVAARVYTTLPELKASLSLQANDTADDDDLNDAIVTASRAVDGDCGRHFWKVTEARSLVPDDLYCLSLGRWNDLVAVTAFKTDEAGDGTFEVTWQAGDYQLLCADGTPNVNAGPEPRPYRKVRAVGARTFPSVVDYTARQDLVQITGTWGWPSVPDRIRRATRMLASELFKLRDAPLGAVGFADLGIIRVRESPRYQRLINDYRLVPVPVA